MAKQNQKVLTLLLAIYLTIILVLLTNALQYQSIVYQTTQTTDIIPTMTAPKSNKRMFVIIIAGFRTGSTLLGEMFNQNQNIVYIFEPLHQNLLWQNRDKIEGSSPNSTLDELRLLYLEHLIKHCKAYTSTYFRNMMNKVKCGLSEEENLEKFNTTHCSLPDNSISRLCLSHDVIAVKTIRIRDISLLHTIPNITDYNIKIIHLLRDPRGTINSRKEFSKFYLRDLEELPSSPLTTEIINKVSHDYCDHEHDNLFLTDFMPDWLEGNYLRVTHSQLSTDPKRVLDRIYGFLDLEIPGSLREWTHNLTTLDSFERGFLTTRKNSSHVLNKWKTGLKPEHVVVIETVCRKVMEKLGLEFMF